MKKKIVLIRPYSPETFWKLSGILEISGKKAVLPPLSLVTVAALTPEDKYEVRIIDEETETLDYDMECDLVGITGFTLHAKRIKKISEEFRKRGKMTVLGGPYCSGHPEECRPFFDVLICGEAEFIWKQFLDDWEKGVHKEMYRETNVIKMEDSPVPRWDLLDMSHYSGSMVQASRGCPYDCEFCDVVTLFGRKMRYKEVRQVIEEIKVLYKLGMWDVFFADDNFIGNKKFIKELMRALIDLNKELKKPIRYMTQVTLNIAEDEELLDLIKKANFYSLFIGIESPKKESLIHTNKAHNAKLNMLEAIRRIQSRGIYIVAGMIVGFDTDDESVFELQSEFLIQAGITLPLLGMLIAPRGTKLWNRLEKENRLFPELEAGDMCAVTNIIPKLIKKEVLEKRYVELFKNLYSCEHFFERYKSFIQQIDFNEIKKESYLSRQMTFRNTRLYFLAATMRLIKHYMFSADKDKRRLFYNVLKISLKKGLTYFPFAIELLIYFKAENEFVNQHQVDHIRRYESQQPDEEQPLAVNFNS